MTLWLGAKVLRHGKRWRFQGRSPRTPFLVCFLYVVYNVLFVLLNLVVSLKGPPTRFNYDYSWCGLPDLVDTPLFWFKNSFTGRPCAFPACHVAILDWATWWPLIGPRYPLPSQHAMSVNHIIMPCQAYGLPRGTI
jgi:hypothetical protein